MLKLENGKRCPVCSSLLHFNFVLRQWEHSDKQKSKKDCNYVLITQYLNS